MSGKEFPIVVAEYERNALEVLRVALDEFRGCKTIDVRIWYRDGAVLKPSKRGITLAIDNLPSLARGCQEALDRALAAGLLTGDR